MAACHAMSHAPGAGQRHLEHPRAQACVRGTTHSTRSSILRGGHPVQNSEGTPDEPDCGSGRRCIAWSACRISTIWAELEMLLLWLRASSWLSTNGGGCEMWRVASGREGE